jgi:hypothetical protein
MSAALPADGLELRTASKLTGYGALAMFLSATVLSGCAPLPDPAPTVAATTPALVEETGEGCLRTVDPPDLDVQAFNLGLPIAGVREDFVQAEVMVVRGAGDCLAHTADPVGSGVPVGACAPPTVTAHDSVGYTLWSSADALTEAMFAAGSEVALSETMTGYAGSGTDTFTYRMAAWQFDSEPDLTRTPVGELLKGCRAVQTEAFLGNDRLILTEGGDLVAALWQRDDVVYLIESIHPLDADGHRLRYAPTSSGLLPTSAMNAIHVWWDKTAPEAMADRQPASHG